MKRLSWIPTTPAKAVIPVDDKQQTYFGIHYMLWYGNGYGSPHWNDNVEFGGVTDKPAGYYGSNQGTTIEKTLANPRGNATGLL